MFIETGHQAIQVRRTEYSAPRSRVGPTDLGFNVVLVSIDVSVLRTSCLVPLDVLASLVRLADRPTVQPMLKGALQISIVECVTPF